jgi:RNA polymerase sigma-70 factor (ECF subfamily)
VDEADFAALYDRYAREIHRFALYLSGNVDTARDVTADTFARAWTARGRIRVGSVKAYLLMIARHLCWDLDRRRTHSQLHEGQDAVDAGADQERSASAREELRRVRIALAALPELDRAILLMATMEGLSYRAVADVVGLSETAVKVRIHRTRVRLNAARGHREDER